MCIRDRIQATRPNDLYEKHRGSATKSELVQDIQNELTRHGYLPAASADGSMGPRTKTAIQEYQHAQGMRVDGVPSQSLLDQMRSH